MAGFSQADSLGIDFKEQVKTFLFDNVKNFKYKEFKKYFNGYKDWSDKKLVGKLKPAQNNTG
jgi:hypothetical protein